MKKRAILIILGILAFIIFVSCNSCTPSTAQGNTTEVAQQDTVFRITAITDTANMSLLMSSPDSVSDTIMFVITKEINEIEIDTTIKFEKTREFQKLEKTERIINEQTATIDSLLSAKKK
jgi:hypothetical protein